jgi:ER-bound oxygenase mpaB/B'/Rubber oxygenase, catalytic domain
MAGPLAAALARARGRGDARLDPLLATGAPAADWLVALREGHPVPPELSDVGVPRWADPARLARAGRFFLRHAAPLSLLLGTTSLLECFACADGARALHAAQRMRQETARRVGATGQFVLSLFGEGAWSDPDGARRTLLRIRVVHAIARRRLVDQGWTGGVPLCQEDQLGTLLAFGFSPPRHLRRLGVHVSRDDIDDSLHLWRVAGAVLGVDVDLLPEAEPDAACLERLVYARNRRASVEGQELTASLLATYGRLIGDQRGNRAFLGLLRHLVGDLTSDLLGVPAAADPRVGPRLALGLGLFGRAHGRIPGTDRLIPTLLRAHADRMATGPAPLVIARTPFPARAVAA